LKIEFEIKEKGSSLLYQTMVGLGLIKEGKE
jgi:hypothetical protein